MEGAEIVILWGGDERIRTVLAYEHIAKLLIKQIVLKHALHVHANTTPGTAQSLVRVPACAFASLRNALQNIFEFSSVQTLLYSLFEASSTMADKRVPQFIGEGDRMFAMGKHDEGTFKA